MNTYIKAHIRAMAEDEVMQMIPGRVIKDIKREDPHPLFKAFVVSHEGVAGITVVGRGKTIQRWFAGAVRALAMKMKIGTKVFSGHAENNDHANRTQIGEVIGKGMEKISGFLSAIAVTYIYPQFKNEDYDIASIEANIMIPKDAKEFEVNEPDVLGITGISLGDSKKDKPAFPDATLQVALQAFAENDPKGENKMKTLEEIKTAVQEGKHKPSDIFGSKELTNDPLIVEQIEEKTNNLRGYNIRKLADSEAKVETLEKKNKDLKVKADEFTKHTLREKGRDIFTTILKERKIDGDKKFKRYVDKMYDKDFSPKDETAIKQDANTFIDKHMDEFKDLFGEAVKVGELSKDDDKSKDKKGVGADEDETKSEDGDNLLDPKNNELIPQD